MPLRKKECILTILLFTCITAALCIKPLSSFNLIINAHDIMRIHYFIKYFIVTMIKQTGEFPLWNPITYSGMPITANPQASFYYPPYWLFLILPVHYCFTILIVLHLIWGGIGMYLYLRRLPLSWQSAVFGAIVFIFNLKTIGQIHAGHSNILYSVMYTPWIMLAADNLLVKKNLRALILFSCCCTLVFFIGHTQLFYYMMLIAAAYFFTRSMTEQSGRKTNSLFLFSGAGILTILLSAILLIPLLEFSRFFNRAGGTDLSFASSLSISLTDAIKETMNPARDLLPYPAFYNLFWEKTVYIGWIPCLLAILSIKNKQLRIHRFFFGGLILFCLLFSLGKSAGLFTALYYGLPGIAFFRVPSRMWFFAVYGCAVLSAIGLNHFSKNISKQTIKIVGLSAASLAGFLFFAYFIGLKKQFVAFRNILFIAGFASFILLFYKDRIKHAFLLQILIMILTFIDLWLLAFPLITAKHIRSMILPESAYRKILKDNDLFRIYDPHRAIPQNTAVRYNLQKINGIDSLLIQNYITFIQSLYNPPIYNPPIIANTLPINDDNRAKLNLLNVKYLFSFEPLPSDSFVQIHATAVSGLPENHPFFNVFYTDDFYPDYIHSHNTTLLFTYRNNDVLPRAFLINVKNRDPYILDYAIKAVSLKKIHPIGETKVTSYKPNNITIEVTAPSQAFLFTSEITYPGWIAHVDGEKTEIIPVYNLFRGIFVPEGKHTVSFTFQPKSFLWGKRITFCALLLCLLYSVLFRKCTSLYVRKITTSIKTDD
ncbi:YfhO family protein [bacterium]|nr:YfhO family protein [bacterium]MCP5462740.1 YfhO family protein [bacterium]